MDILYEECAHPKNENRAAVIYKIFHIASVFFYVFGAILGVFGLLTAISIPNLIFNLILAATQIGFAALLGWIKKRFNVSYDYIFVSGELRISKVINTNKRKLVARFETEDMLQVGDVDSASYDRLKSDPMTKTIICTSNDEAAEGKFFLYILANYNGKKLFVLECREDLLINIMKVAKRGVLDRDYVSQEKKKASV